jgi:hypothetical protein
VLACGVFLANASKDNSFSFDCGYYVHLIAPSYFYVS